MTYVCYKSTVISAFVSPTKNCVHIYNNANKQHVIRVPASIVDTTLAFCNVNDDNDDAGIPEWKLYILTEDGYIYIVTESSIKNVQRDNSSKVAVGNQEIFDDLIQNDSFTLESTSEPVFVLSSHQAVYKEEETVHSLKVSCGLVAIVTCTPTSWNISLYTEKLFHEGKNRSTKQLQIFYKSYPRKQNSSEDLKLPLYFIVSDLISMDNCCSSDTLTISASFFKSLFGTEPGLLNSPVLMFCSPGGTVNYTPIKSLDESLVQPKVLCHLICQVVKISPICISHNQNDNFFSGNQQREDKKVEGILIFAANGRCLFIKQSENGEVMFTSMCMPGPVLDFDVHCNRLFVSTGNDVLESTFGLVNESNEILVKLYKPESLMSSNIKKVTCLPKTNETISDRCDLLCEQLNGDVRVLDPETCKSNMSTSTEVGTGQELKDLLQSIETCSINSERLNNMQHRQSEFMKQIAIASTLISDYKYNRKSFFKSVVKVNKPDSGLVQNLKLSCHITNESFINLSCDWSAMVTVGQWEDSVCEWSTHCIQLCNGLQPGNCVNLCVPVKKEYVYLPFVIQVYLILHLQDTFDEERVEIFEKEESELNIISVLIDEQNIDVLNFLQDEGPSVTNSVKLPSSSQHILESLAASRAVKNCFDVGQSVINQVDQSCTMTVSVSSQLINNDIIKDFGNDEIAILKYLLKDSNLLQTPVAKHITMVTMTGDKVHLSISRTSEEKLQIEIKCYHTGVCTAVRMAVLYRLKMLREENLSGNVTVHKLRSLSHDCQGYLKDFEEIDDLPETGGDNPVMMDRVIGLYKQMRLKDSI